MGTKRGQNKGRSKKPGNLREAKAVGLQRLAMVSSGALFLVLFIVVAAAEGVGSPTVPDGDVAIVTGLPEDTGNVSKAEFRHAMVQAAAQGGLKAVPKPGESKYDELKEAALGELLDAVWIRGQAEEMGIEATPKQIADELAQIKEQNFKGEGAFKKFLKEARFTKADVLKRVRLQIYSNKIQSLMTEGGAPPSESDAQAFYDAAKASQFTEKASRDVRMILAKSKEKAEAAKKKLAADNSEKSWKAAAKKFSTDPTSKSTGGLQQGLTEEVLASAPPLKEAVFGTPVKQLVGPIDYEGKYVVLEPVKVTPEKVRPFKDVKSQIVSQLTQTRQQEDFSEFVSDYQSKWTSRTFCAEGFVIQRCANYVGDGRPSSAPPTCYEANPKGGTPSECPAPVTANSPALPGSVSLLTPQGTRLPQRPLPEAGAAEEGAASGLPPGISTAPPE